MPMQPMLKQRETPPRLKQRERAERYRQIAQNIFDAKIAREIEKIAADYEDRASEELVSEHTAERR
jgi:hypothetical protein